MRERVMFGVGIGVLVVAALLMILPVQRVPMLDANRQLLAETEAQAYCAGSVFLQTRGVGSHAAMQECLDISDKPTDINPEVAQRAFCEGLIGAGYQIEQESCMTIMEGQRYWPLKSGTLTNAWNKRFPYPGNVLGTEQANESRTGDRDLNERENTGR